MRSISFQRRRGGRCSAGSFSHPRELPMLGGVFWRVVGGGVLKIAEVTECGLSVYDEAIAEIVPNGKMGVVFISGLILRRVEIDYKKVARSCHLSYPKGVEMLR